MNYTHVDESVLKSIREVIDDVPVCEKCGGDADDCGCDAVDEDEEIDLKEPSGDKEEIIINPEIDAFSAAKQQKVDEWKKAAKLKEGPQHFWVGAREFADRNAANHYAKSIGGVVTPTANPDHKGFKSVEKKPLSKAEKDAKWNERMPWPSDYRMGRGSSSPISAFANSFEPKGNQLTESGVQMHKDRLGIFFTADGLGDRRFKTKKEAETAYNEFRKKADQKDREQRNSDPNRVEYDEKSKKLIVYTNGKQEHVHTANDRQQARRIFNDKYYDGHTLVFV